MVTRHARPQPGRYTCLSYLTSNGRYVPVCTLSNGIAAAARETHLLTSLDDITAGAIQREYNPPGNGISSRLQPDHHRLPCPYAS